MPVSVAIGNHAFSFRSSLTPEYVTQGRFSWKISMYQNYGFFTEHPIIPHGVPFFQTLAVHTNAKVPTNYWWYYWLI